MKVNYFHEKKAISTAGVLRGKDRVARQVRREQDQDIRSAVQFKSASGFLAEIEETK